MGNSKAKGRTSVTYNRKVARMKARHARAVKKKEERIEQLKKDGKPVKVKPVGVIRTCNRLDRGNGRKWHHVAIFIFDKEIADLAFIYPVFRLCLDECFIQSAKPRKVIHVGSSHKGTNCCI